jgi:hypothetical protein
MYKTRHSGRDARAVDREANPVMDVFKVMPSLALDSSIHAGMTMIWVEHYSHADFLL